MMEKVVLLVEHSGAHLRCLLNPEHLELKRSAGVVARQSQTGAMTGIGLSDDPLLYCGGGSTELTLDLLFDISLVPRRPDTPPVDDVRKLTGPLWQLAENPTTHSRYGRPPTVRFLWGASWNLRGLVTAVSERLEQFDAEGRAGRSWLRLRLRRVESSPIAEPNEPTAPPMTQDEARQRSESAPSHTYHPAGSDSGERVDQIAAERFGHPGLWAVLADANGIDDPMMVDEKPLRVPSEPLVSSPREAL